eukprot:3755221-Pyramimonas_sp.AAC.1
MLDREHLLNFEIKQALDHECWIRAVNSHPCGKGAQAGVDFSDYDKARVLRAVATGALRPAARRFGGEGRGGIRIVPSPPDGSPAAAGASAAADATCSSSRGDPRPPRAPA